MKNALHSMSNWSYSMLTMALIFSVTFTMQAQRLPYEILNNSEFSDDEVFVVVVGEELPGGKFVWVDAATGQINRMSRSDNTVPGPQINGNPGPGLDGRYADCFRRLSEIPNKTVQIPQIAGCRILISFKSQMYLYFFGYDSDPRGYAGANLENETDPNQGITFEVIELTYNEFGIFNNTSRVDAFQYPIGLEVTGVDFFKKVGELKSREEIFNRWEQQVPAPFKQLLDRERGLISFPTKNPNFPKDYFAGYIDAIWNKYRNEEIYFNSGDAGRWRGNVNGDNFVFRRESDGQVATIFGKPSTLEAMEGSGVMAQGQRWDLVVQAQFVAAITRHAIDLNTGSGQFQDFGDASKYYQTEPYNWYAKFLHQRDISFEGQTYAFAYDDVFDQSATISTPQPLRAKITLGTISGGGTTPPPPPPPTGDAVTTLYIDCPFAGGSAGFEVGNYTRAQLVAKGIQDNNLSSLRVQNGFRVELFAEDNFSGRSVTVTGDASCLTASNLNFNDVASSMRVSRVNTTTPPTGNTGNRIEAESFFASNDVQLEDSSEGGQNVGYINPGSFMAYENVAFPSTGTYQIEYRVASAIGGGVLSSDLDAGAVQLGQIDIPNTGGWQTYTTITQNVQVNAGTYNFGIFAVNGGWNIDWFRVTRVGNKDGLNASANNSVSSTVYPNPTTGTVSIQANAENITATVFDLQGRVVLEEKSIISGGEIQLSNLPKGVYIIQAVYADAIDTHQIIKR